MVPAVAVGKGQHSSSQKLGARKEDLAAGGSKVSGFDAHEGPCFCTGCHSRLLYV